MNLSSLSNDELVKKLLELRETEKETTLKLLYYLIELDNRRLYTELGFSSLFDYCQRGLKYSEGSSYRRVTAARALRENPEIAELYISGKVTLCTICAASKSIREKRTEVSEIVGKSKREVEVLVAPTVQPSKLKESIKPMVLEVPREPLFSDTPKKEELYKITFSLSKEAFRKYERVRDILSGKLGSKLSIEGVFNELLTRELRRRKTRKVKKSTRYIPLSLKQEVRERDNHQCSYVSEEGIKCTETKYLQFDHVVPFSKGGDTESSNLRLLCPSHNLLHAQRVFGKEYMSTFTGGGK